MHNKKYLPSLGFITLLVTVVSSILFIKWVLGPISYEKAASEELLGHQLTKAGNTKEALKHFLTAARITDVKDKTSRRYRSAATVSTSRKDKIKYFQLALKYNPKNKNAKNGLKLLSSEITYFNRWSDGWSKGKTASIFVDTSAKSSIYGLTYLTYAPQKIKHIVVKILVDGKLYKEHVLTSGKINSMEITLSKGEHYIDLSINETFNPRKLGLSKDGRELGVHFKIKKQVSLP